MKTFRTGVIFILALLACQLYGQDTSKNIYVHDPVMIRQNGTYYLFSTGHGIKVRSSKDMINWKTEKPVFASSPEWTQSVVEGFKGHIWAPDIIYRNGKYYLYYSVSAFGKNTSAIGVATNATLDPEDPDFNWMDHGIVIQSHPNRDLWNAIDPNIIIDEDQVPWMSFGSFWNGLKMVKLKKNMLEIAEPQEWHTIARRERSFDFQDSKAGDAALEAPFIFKKDSKYYLFLSWDLCCRGEKSTYKVVVGRSDNATGPYIDKDGKPLFMGGGSILVQGDENWYGAGHNSIYTFDGKDYLVFHAYDASDEGKSKLRIKEVDWQDGWPVMNNPLE